MKFSVLGPAGTFADDAAKAYLKKQTNLSTNVEIQYYPTFDQVYESVQGSNIGLLPLENQLDGYVSATLQRLASSTMTEIGEIAVPVDFGLIANVAELSDVKRIFVQFKTEGQCQQLLNKIPNAEITTTSSNMVSLEKFRAGQPGDAAIIPQAQMTKQTGALKINNVADQSDNSTRFIVFRSTPAKLETAPAHQLTTSHFKAPFFVTPASNDQPGTLFKILGNFANADLNLVTIMSLPTKVEMGVYTFYIEISGQSDQLPSLVTTLVKMTAKEKIHFLGYYSV